MQRSIEFMKHIKTNQFLLVTRLISFDVISLVTNVPLDATIDIVLKRIYDNSEINTTIDKREIKELINTKDAHCNFNGTTYVQKDGVAMGSPLATALAGILMVKLERAIIPKLSQHIQFWKRYVDDTICFLCNGYQEFVFSCLNSFHNSIQFTYMKLKKKMKYSFLKSQSYVFKRSNISREHFHGINENENEVTSKRKLILLYPGEKGYSIVRSQLNRSLPNNVNPNIVFTGTKLSSNFNLIDPVPFTKKHDVIYRSVCATESCNEDYVGECARRLYERLKKHNGRDHSSHLVKHAEETVHLTAQLEAANFEVIESGYHNNARRRKIAEPLLIKKLKPTLNIQEKLLPLKLFN